MQRHTFEMRLARAWSVVHTARRIADPREPLGLEARQRLPESSGLSPEGVRLALGRYLETDPTPAELRQLVASTTTAERCLVLLAANVCSAPLRALACAAATSPRVLVRPSSRDPVLAELLVRGLAVSHDFARAGGQLEQVAELGPRSGDELHLYGSDDTISTLRVHLPEGARVRAHGSGVGLAVIGPVDDLGIAAERLAADLVPFDAKGCLSPRIALVEGDLPRTRAAAQRLHEALDRWSAPVPRGPLDELDQAALSRFRSLMDALGARWAGRDHDVFVDPAPESLLLPPAQRCALLVPCDAHRAEPLLNPLARYVTAIGRLDETARPTPLLRRLLDLAPHARHGRLGQMHAQPLDGPMDLRTIAG